MDRGEILRIEGLVKVFGGARAVDNLNLLVKAGSIHGIVGQNGSGKSTLIKVLAGYHKPNSGLLWFAGQAASLPVEDHSPGGVHLSFVHQDLGLVDGMSIVENYFIDDIAGAVSGDLGGRWVNKRAREKRIERELRAYGLDLAPYTRDVAELQPLEKAMLAIVRAVRSQGVDNRPRQNLLVLDEPTVYLPTSYRPSLYEIIRQVVADGRSSVIVVSHDIDEVLELADRISIMRDGQVVKTVERGEVGRGDVIRLMVGEKAARVEDQFVRVRAHKQRSWSMADPVLEIENVVSTSGCRVNIAMRRGEIVGVAGLPGSGYESVPRIINGDEPIVSGSVRVGGLITRVQRRAIHDRIRSGVVMIPRERLTEGCVGDLSVNENMFLPISRNFSRLGFVDWSSAWSEIAHTVAKFNVVPADGTRLMATLSGGNQQKVVFAKWAQTSPKVMVLEEPTQGVDVGARAVLWQFIADAAELGVAILISSSDYNELMTLCDRVIVFRRGVNTTVLSGDDLTKERITEACY